MVPITGAGAEAITELVSVWLGQKTGVWELPAPVVASLLPVCGFAYRRLGLPVLSGHWGGGWSCPSTGKIHALLCIGSFYSKIGII